MAIALRLDEKEADTLLESGGCPPIQALRAAEQKNEDQEILAFWTREATQVTATSAVLADDGNTSGKFLGVRQIVSRGLIAVAAATAIFTIYSPRNYFQTLSIKTSETDSAKLEDSFVMPVIKPVKLGRQCLIDLAVQPTGAVWALGESSDCPELNIAHQYAKYTREDLVPWNEGVAQCWAGPNLERLWIAFDLPGGEEGWLLLSSFGTNVAFFREDEPQTPTLWASPDDSSTIVGRFEYEELAGNASKMLLDFPEKLDPTKAFEDGRFHLGGCWQAADRDNYKGIHFYWPHDTELTVHTN